MPADSKTYGYLSEHHSFGETDQIAGDYAEELAAEMLATTLNVEFDPDKSWDEKKEVYRLSNKIVRTTNITQSAIGDKSGHLDDDHRGGDPDLRLEQCLCGFAEALETIRGFFRLVHCLDTISDVVNGWERRIYH